jgi:hypothetical protein
MNKDKEVTESKEDATNAKAVEQSKEFLEAKKIPMSIRSKVLFY